MDIILLVEESESRSSEGDQNASSFSGSQTLIDDVRCRAVVAVRGRVGPWRPGEPRMETINQVAFRNQRKNGLW